MFPLTTSLNCNANKIFKDEHGSQSQTYRKGISQNHFKNLIGTYKRNILRIDISYTLTTSN